MSNPLLEVADIRALSDLAKKHGLQLVVDNTFTPLIFSPSELGADIVIHSLTKFINGASDAVGGIVCSSKDFVMSLIDVNDGAAMLLGPTMDAIKANGILKNLRTLHVRMKQHSYNAMYLANKFQELGIKVYYPGLKSIKKAYELMEEMQNNNIGYLAVSLGFYKTLFSAPGASTSSEIPEHEQKEMGISEGMVRLSIGLDNDIERTFQKIKDCLKKVKLI